MSLSYSRRNMSNNGILVNGDQKTSPTTAKHERTLGNVSN